MHHRHLNHQRMTLAAIDDVIACGNRQDRVDLQRSTLADRTVMEKVRQVCRAYVADPYAQRYRF